MKKFEYVNYDFDTLSAAAIDVIKEGDSYWKDRPDNYFKSFTHIELLEWAIKDTFMNQIPYNEKHDILFSAMQDLRQDGYFKQKGKLS